MIGGQSIDMELEVYSEMLMAAAILILIIQWRLIPCFISFSTP